MPSTKKPSTKATAKKLLESATDPGEPSLTESGRRLIEDIEAQWQLNSASRALLKLAAHSVSIAERASAVIEVEQPVYIDRFGAPRPRPEVGILKDANNAAAAALDKLLKTLEG